MQPHLPAISSPLAPSTSQRGRRLLRLGPPIASITSTPSPSQLNLPPGLVASTQSQTLPNSSPFVPAVSTQSYLTTSPAASVRNSPKQINSTPATTASTPGASILPMLPSIQSGLLIAPNASEQAPSQIRTLVSGQAPPRDPLSTADTGEVSLREFSEGNASPRIQLNSSALMAPHPAAVTPSASGSVSPREAAPEIFKRPVSCGDPIIGVPILIYQRSSIYRPGLYLILPPAYKLG